MSKIRLIDIGAANTRFSDGWNEFKDNIELILFEPDSRSYKELAKKATVYTCALGAADELRQLHLTRKPEVSSFFQPNRRYVDLFPNKDRWDILDKANVRTKALDSLHKDIGDIDFIKIDVQGAELEVLEGGKKTLLTALGLELEVEFLEIYKGQPLFGDVCRFVSDQGFEFYDFVTEYRYGRKNLNRKGQLAFADALFLRTPEYLKDNPKIFNSKKIMKYLEIAYIYKKIDLIEVILDYFSNNKEVFDYAKELIRRGDH
jgi:FkbM family methyltransferase